MYDGLKKNRFLFACLADVAISQQQSDEAKDILDYLI